MNESHPVLTIDLTLDRQSTREVLTALLHSILFHRLFGLLKPQTFQILDVTLPGVCDKEIESMVNDRVATFWAAIENDNYNSSRDTGISPPGTGLHHGAPAARTQGGNSKKGSLTVTFSEKKPKKGWFQVYVGEEDVPWEQWDINVELRQNSSHSAAQYQSRTDTSRKSDEALSATLSQTLMKILTHTTSERGRAAVPPITNNVGITPFPVRITARVGGREIV